MPGLTLLLLVQFSSELTDHSKLDKHEWWISRVDNSTMYSLDAFTTQYYLTTVCL